MQSQITESRRFKVDGYTVTFAAGVKNSHAVVVFGIMTGLEAVPVFTLEKKLAKSGGSGKLRPESNHRCRRKTPVPLSGKLSHYGRED